MEDLEKPSASQAKEKKPSSFLIAMTVASIIAAGYVGYKTGQKNVFDQFYVSHIQGLLPGTGLVSTPAEDTSADNPIVAKVDNQAIRRKDVVNLVNAMPPQMQQIPLPQLYPMALEQAISNKIVDKKAAGSGLERDKDVQKQVKQAKEQIIRTKFLENEITSRVDDARVKVEYEKYLKEFPDIQEVKAAHILVEDEKLAKELIAKLNDGESFSELAKEHSQDGSGQNGGDLGYFAENEVVPEFSKAAFAAKVGAYIKKPVKSDFGYHIIRVDEKRKRPPAEFDKIKPYIAQELQRTVFDETLTEWKAAANIERFDVNGKPVSEEENAAEPAAGAEESEQKEKAE